MRFQEHLNGCQDCQLWWPRLKSYYGMQLPALPVDSSIISRASSISNFLIGMKASRAIPWGHKYRVKWYVEPEDYYGSQDYPFQSSSYPSYPLGNSYIMYMKFVASYTGLQLKHEGHVPTSKGRFLALHLIGGHRSASIGRYAMLAIFDNSTCKIRTQVEQIFACSIAALQINDLFTKIASFQLWRWKQTHSLISFKKDEAARHAQSTGASAISDVGAIATGRLRGSSGMTFDRACGVQCNIITERWKIHCHDSCRILELNCKVAAIVSWSFSYQCISFIAMVIKGINWENHFVRVLSPEALWGSRGKRQPWCGIKIATLKQSKPCWRMMFFCPNGKQVIDQAFCPLRFWESGIQNSWHICSQFAEASQFIFWLISNC